MNQQELSFADYAAAVMRRFTVALFTFVAVFVLGVYVVYSLPAKYRSTGIISIEQYNVSPDLVEMTDNSYANEQIESAWRRVMLTSSLATIIEQYGLYPDLMEVDSTGRLAAEALRENTYIEPQSVQYANPESRDGRDASIAFALSFDHTDAQTTQDVATDLAQLYLKENVEGRASQTAQTLQFLRLDIQTAREEADRAAAELADFKERHAGNLPELLNFHLQSIERTEQQLDALDREIRDSRNRQFTIETELARTNPFSNSTDAEGNPIVGTADRLAQLQAERMRLLSIYTPEHADVKRIEREIEILSGGNPNAGSIPAIRAQLEAVEEELRMARRTGTEDHPDVVRLTRNVEVLRQQLENALASGSQQPALADLASRDPVVQQLRQQAETEQTYNQSLRQRRAELESKLEELRGKVAAMPQIEREYAALVRQNEQAVQRYNEAVDRIDAAQRAQSLEQEGVGDRFTLVESPYLPLAPYSPNRKMLVMLLLIVAVGGGIGLAVVFDNLDDSVKSSNDLTSIAGAPPIAVIPVLETPSDRRRRVAAVMGQISVFAGGMAAAFGIATALSG